MKNYENANNYSYKTVGQLQKAMSNIEAILSNYNSDIPLQQLNDEAIKSIIYFLESSSLSCRKFADDYNSSDDSSEMLLNKQHPFPYDNAFNISFQNDVLIIKTPLTLKRINNKTSLKENYAVVGYLKARFNEWVEKNGDVLYGALKGPLIVVMKRKTMKFSVQTICDNDNLENGRYINEIFERLGHADNAKVMDIYSCWRKCDSAAEEGMEFIIFKRQDMFQNAGLI